MLSIQCPDHGNSFGCEWVRAQSGKHTHKNARARTHTLCPTLFPPRSALPGVTQLAREQQQEEEEQEGGGDDGVGAEPPHHPSRDDPAFYHLHARVDRPGSLEGWVGTSGRACARLHVCAHVCGSVCRYVRVLTTVKAHTRRGMLPRFRRFHTEQHIHIGSHVSHTNTQHNTDIHL